MGALQMNFGIYVVRDDELPAGIKRVVVERDGAPPLLLLAESNPSVDFALRYHEDYVEDAPPARVHLRAV